MGGVLYWIVFWLTFMGTAAINMYEFHHSLLSSFEILMILFAAYSPGCWESGLTSMRLSQTLAKSQSHCTRIFSVKKEP